MGFTVRNLAYNQGTNTLTGNAVQNQRVTVGVDGQVGAHSYEGQSDPVTGAFSIVLTGIANGAHVLQVGLNRTSDREIAITKV